MKSLTCLLFCSLLLTPSCLYSGPLAQWPFEETPAIPVDSGPATGTLPLAAPTRSQSSATDHHSRADGFRGIWFDLGQRSEYGSKYSGGLGTYTANHVPMAHYVTEAHRTYLTWGGTPAADQRRLQIVVSYYDHSTGNVARPVIVMDKSPVDDPHDNGSLSIDDEGHLWIFVSGRGNNRLGSVFRSKEPHSIDEWVRLPDWEFTYPQPWWFESKGFLFT
jgi:hypothetical protein